MDTSTHRNRSDKAANEVRETDYIEEPIPTTDFKNLITHIRKNLRHEEME